MIPHFEAEPFVREIERIQQASGQLDRRRLIPFYYHILGFTLIPLDPLTGKPLVQWAQYEDPHNRPTWEQTVEWFKDNNKGIAVLLGAASDNTFCLDEDKVGLLLQILHGNLNALNSLVQKSPSDKYHLFLKDRACKISILRFVDDQGTPVAEIKGNGHLVTLVPSLHRELHEPYTNFSPTLQVREIHGIISLLVNSLNMLGYKTTSPVSTGYIESGPITAGSLWLSEWQMSQLTSILAQLWFDHEHNIWIVRAGGFLLRLGIDEKQAANFLSTLAGQLGCKSREHTAQKVYREVLRLYGGATKGKRVLGLTSLFELAEQHNRPDLGKQLLALNTTLKQDDDIRRSTQEWLEKKFGAKEQ